MKKWPWERRKEESLSSDEDENAQNFSNRDMYKKFKPSQSHNNLQGMELQKFIFEDGFIQCHYKKDLVLGVKESDQEGRVVDVLLMKKTPDDIYQRWNIKENG